MNKIFDVIVGEEIWGVWNIPNKSNGSLNGEPENWWVYCSTELPEGLTPPEDSEYFEPYSNQIIRRVWDIRFKQRNSTKHKWDSLNFRNHLFVEMFCNGKLVYAFGTSGNSMDYAMAKVQYLQVQMQEHTYNFFEPEENNGRKIFWYGLPATIKVKSDTWEIAVIPDYTELTRKEWQKEYKNRKSFIGKRKYDNEIDEDHDVDEAEDYINWGDALSDAHIDWFR